MKKQSSQSLSNYSGIVSSIAILTCFLFLLEISFFIQCNKAYLSDFTFVTNQIHIPAAVIPGILYFIAAQIAVHIVYALFLILVVRSLAGYFSPDNGKSFYAAIGIWFLGLALVLVLNQYYYPNSKFAELTYVFLPNLTITRIVLYSLLAVWSVLLFLSAWVLVKQLRFLPIVMAGIMLLFLFDRTHKPLPAFSPATAARPNVILVGVDSLRPDFLGFYGHDKPTPFLDTFLTDSVSFGEAVTPLARTFPSWTSVLTGQYPRQHGIRFNLASQDRVKLSNTLPAILHRQGYTTIYATDETRFSNIDVNFGFDQVITPPVGLNDFLLGTFNDFPLSNLLINSSVGKWLFPYSYANRPVYFTYDPDSFLHQLRPVIYQHQQRPVMLAVHFCLPHYPYLWGQLDGKRYNYLERYEASVQRVDQQLRDFFTMLQKAHLLDHAVVVVMSDHGEALELAGDRITERSMFVQQGRKHIPAFYPPSLDKEEVNQSAGHGTDVLGLPQYHSLLAFRVYGGDALVPDVIPGVVSLLDIKPTVLQLLGLSSDGSSGISLVQILHGSRQPLKPRHLFLESDYTPEAIRTVYPETRDVMLEGVQLFKIDERSTRLTVKDAMANMIIHSKQFADIYGNWMLAIYPQSSDANMPILINLVSGEWTNDLHSTLAEQSPARLMLGKMTNFFGNDLK